MAGLALQLGVPMVVASIPGLEVGEECWNSGLNSRLEAVAASIYLDAAVAATSKAACYGRPSPHHRGCWIHMRIL
jgi:hypothetical protein